MGFAKSLMKDTALYGLSSIVGRFLNYLLVPLYTAVMPAASGQYGVVTNFYAYTALILVLLTFGMETTFFRFANKEEEQPLRVYSTTLITVGTLSGLFVLFGLLFLHPLAHALGYSAHPEYLGIMICVVALDAFLCIPFTYLRYQKRPMRFMVLKLINILMNIGLNLFVFLLCPIIHRSHPEWIAWFYDSEYMAGYVFAINLLTTVATAVLLLPELTGFRWQFDGALFRRMFRYSFPILILGLAGILNQTADKILYPFLVPGRDGEVQLGIYGAAAKIAMIMAMFTQAFRYAYEPIVFGSSRDKNDVVKVNVLGMKYFIIFTLLGFLVVMAYLDVFKVLLIRNTDYWVGLRVVPIVMAAEIMMGIYFNLSFWYKLIDRTIWGAWFSLLGCIVLIAVNCLFVPRYGYIACAWAGVAGYGVCMVASYVVGQHKNPIPYDLKSATRYLLLAAVLFAVMMYLPLHNMWLRIAIHTLLLALYVGYMVRRDFPLTALKAKLHR
jgi:O-antigen/teichoic acid export membrane protein